MRKKRITAAIDLTTSGVRHFCGCALLPSLFRPQTQTLHPHLHQ